MSNERELTAAEMANHYVQKSLSGRKWYEITYWKRVYDKCHPKLTKPGTNGRKMCLAVLKEALSWHLENTTNGDERTKIAHALKEINGYPD